jgi:hypothetical protein
LADNVIHEKQNTMQNIIKINKSELNKISFSQEEVLAKKFQDERTTLLKSAIGKKKDGTGKVEITFQSKERGKFKVVTPILTAGKEYLVIKGGQTIPINSIIKISL